MEHKATDTGPQPNRQGRYRNIADRKRRLFDVGEVSERPEQKKTDAYISERPSNAPHPLLIDCATCGARRETFIDHRATMTALHLLTLSRGGFLHEVATPS